MCNEYSDSINGQLDTFYRTKHTITNSYLKRNNNKELIANSDRNDQAIVLEGSPCNNFGGTDSTLSPQLGHYKRLRETRDSFNQRLRMGVAVTILLSFQRP